MPDLDHERQFNGPVIGIDEAGRGPWAGPVTVTAIWLCPTAYDELPADIDDSKKNKAATPNQPCGSDDGAATSPSHYID